MRCELTGTIGDARRGSVDGEAVCRELESRLRCLALLLVGGKPRADGPNPLPSTAVISRPRCEVLVPLHHQVGEVRADFKRLLGLLDRQAADVDAFCIKLGVLLANLL